MRLLTEKAAKLCGCTSAMQEKITAECLRWYDLELGDSESVYQFIDGKSLIERFQPFIWMLKRFSGNTNMVYAIVYYMAYIQYTRYEDAENADACYKAYAVNYNELTSTKKKALNAVIDEEAEVKSGWR